MTTGDDSNPVTVYVPLCGLIENFSITSKDNFTFSINAFPKHQHSDVKQAFKQHQIYPALASIQNSNGSCNHLNESQRAMIGAKIANISQGERTDIEPSANWQKVSQPEAAKMLSIKSLIFHFCLSI